MKPKNSLVVLQYRGGSVVVNGNVPMTGAVTLDNLEQAKKGWHAILKHIIPGAVITNVSIINVIELED